MTVKTAINDRELIELAGGGDDRPRLLRVPQRSYVTGIILFLAPVVMFFLALTSALVVRKGLGGDWMPLTLPRVLWFTTGVILLSSVTLELARRQLRANILKGFRLWWGVSTVLGLAFLAGQLAAWRDLAAQGIYVASNPSSSFFYVLTGAHGVHLLGGLIALPFAGFREPRPDAKLTRATAVRVAAIYWHFMGGLWIFLYLLLWLGR